MLPGDAIFNVVEQTFRHQRVFIQVHQVGSLRVKRWVVREGSPGVVRAVTDRERAKK